MLPGGYKIKFLARDAETGRIGTLQKNFVIPNLNKEEKRIPISSVILSSQRTGLRDALYNATKEKDRERIDAANPLIQDGQKLIPSVTRVFHTERDLYVFLQAYDRGTVSGQPLVAFVTFYRGQTKAFETPPLAVTDPPDPQSKAVPLRFSLSLSKLPPGEYNCQVTVVSPAGQKASFWQAPVMLIREDKNRVRHHQPARKATALRTIATAFLGTGPPSLAFTRAPCLVPCQKISLALRWQLV